MHPNKITYYLSYNIPELTRPHHQRESITHKLPYSSTTDGIKDLQLTIDWLKTKIKAKYHLIAKSNNFNN